jgi:hypothetical protein
MAHMAYPNDLVRNLLGFALSFLEICGRAIKLGRIRIFVKVCPDTKQFLVDGKLIPRRIISARSESQVVPLAELRCARGA